MLVDGARHLSISLTLTDTGPNLVLILYPLVNTRAAPEGKRGNGTRCHIACFHRGDNEKECLHHSQFAALLLMNVSSL